MKKEGIAIRGLSPLELIQLDYKETKQYNCDCNFIEHKITSKQRLDYTLEVAPSRTNLQRNFTKSPLKPLINAVAICFTFVALMGCSKPIYKVQTKEVLIPIKCNLKLPQKPQENGSFESHKALAIYYQKVEQIAKDCTQ